MTDHQSTQDLRDVLDAAARSGLDRDVIVGHAAGLGRRRCAELVAELVRHGVEAAVTAAISAALTAAQNQPPAARPGTPAVTAAAPPPQRTLRLTPSSAAAFADSCRRMGRRTAPGTAIQRTTASVALRVRT